MIRKLATAVLALTTAGLAQSFTLPSPPLNTSSSSVPFGSIRMRWQVWFSAAQWQATLGHPARITRIEFMTNASGQTGRQIQLEVRMANSFPLGPTGDFAANLVAGTTMVHPATVGAPRAFTTPTTVAGAYALGIPCANSFVWDGTSGVVIDVRIYDNGNNNVPYPYDLAIETFGNGRIATLWNDTGNPDATGSNQFQQRGPRMRFLYADGVTLSFGTGCPGEGIITPVASTTGGYPRPNNPVWTHLLTNAPSQRQAIWVFGDSNTQWLTLPLPYPLTILGAGGCDLLVKPDLTATLTTVGGGPGAGSVSLTTPTPPVTSIVGLSFYVQWLVIDPNAPNGVLAVSNGQWHSFGP